VAASRQLTLASALGAREHLGILRSARAVAKRTQLCTQNRNIHVEALEAKQSRHQSLMQIMP
jgi:hypothetical protein